MIDIEAAQNLESRMAGRYGGTWIYHRRRKEEVLHQADKSCRVWWNQSCPKTFHKETVQTLNKGHINDKESLVDPCLFYWKSKVDEVILIAVVHVDNVLLFGKNSTIERSSWTCRKGLIVFRIWED